MDSSLFYQYNPPLLHSVCPTLFADELKVFCLVPIPSVAALPGAHYKPKIPFNFQTDSSLPARIFCCCSHLLLIHELWIMQYRNADNRSNLINESILGTIYMILFYYILLNIRNKKVWAVMKKWPKSDYTFKLKICQM